MVVPTARLLYGLRRNITQSDPILLSVYKHFHSLFFFVALFSFPSILCPLSRDVLFCHSLTPLTRSLNHCHCRNGSHLFHRSSRSCCGFCRLRSCYSTQSGPLGLGNGRSSGLFTTCLR